MQVRPLGPIPVKGLVQPIEVFELTGAAAVRSRLQASAVAGFTRFVGREREMDALNAALESAGTSLGQVVAVVGEPGVGKSRLYYEFVHSHRTRDWLVLESGSVSHGKATAYLPLIDLLKNYFQIENADDARRIRERVTGMAAIGIQSDRIELTLRQTREAHQRANLRYSGDNIQVEHWVVAERLGQTAALNMLGHREKFNAVPFFWSQHYDVPINYVGHAEKWDELKIDGDIAAKDCLLSYKSNGRVLAVASIYRDVDSLRTELAMEQQVI